MESIFGKGQSVREDWDLPCHSVRGWQSAVQNGCHICSLLYGQIPLGRLGPWLTDLMHESADDSARLIVKIWKPAYENDESGVLSLHWSLRWSLRLIANVPNRPLLWIVPSGSLIWTKVSRSGSPDLAIDRIYNQPQSRTTKSHASLDQARDWLQKCLLHHEECNSRVNATLPTRLLDTGTCTNESKIRLVSGSALHAAVPYIALSHCWGGNCSTKLTRPQRCCFFSLNRSLDSTKNFP
jgi:hypothetical protein